MDGNKMLHGAYHWDPNDVKAFENDLLPEGEMLDFVSLTGDPLFQSLGNMWDGSQSDIEQMFDQTSRTLQVNPAPHRQSSPPIDYGPAINGQYDDEIRNLAQRLVDLNCEDAILRICGEYNQSWSGNYPGGSSGDISEFEEMFAHTVSVFESVTSGTFTYLLNPAGDVSGGTLGIFQDTNPENSSRWPSSAKPLVTAPTFYDQDGVYPEGGSNPTITQDMREEAWQDHVQTLQFVQDIADSRGSPMGSVEWGCELAGDDGRGFGGGDNPYYINHVFDFMESNGWIIQGYWNGPQHAIWPLDDPEHADDAGRAWSKRVSQDMAGIDEPTLEKPTVGGYNYPEKGTVDWHVPLNENFADIENDIQALADFYGSNISISLNTPPKGTPDWHIHMNENFEEIDTAVQELVDGVRE